MSKDYIERGALLKHLCNSCDGWCENTNCDCVNCKSEHRCDIVQELDDAPTIDAVPVVRCKDCKSHKPGTAMAFVKNGEHIRLCHCDRWGRNVRDNDFCSYGERKDGDSDGTH